MQITLPTLLNNPVTALCSAAITAAATLSGWSALALINTLLNQPEIDLRDLPLATAASPINSREISQRNFFGLATQQQEIPTENLPQTELSLVLRGAFSTDQNGSAGAIIEDERRQAHYYAIGEELPGLAVTLESVQNDRVILSRNGVFETLFFPQEGNEASGIDSRRSLQPAESGGALNITNISPAEAEARRKAIRERINKLRTK